MIVYYALEFSLVRISWSYGPLHPPPSFCAYEQEIINYPSFFIEDVQSVGPGGGWAGARDLHIVQTGSCTNAAVNIRWIPEIKQSRQEADRPLPFSAELNISRAKAQRVSSFGHLHRMSEGRMVKKYINGNRC